MKFFRLLARVRFWKRRAQKAEHRIVELIEQYVAEVAELKAANDAEMYRNREREDTLITVPMRLGGLWGMPARTGPAAPKQVNRPPQLTASADPWDSLTWADKQEFQMFWKADADAMGIPELQARQQFLATLEKRRVAINDDPSN